MMNFYLTYLRARAAAIGGFDARPRSAPSTRHVM